MCAQVMLRSSVQRGLTLAKGSSVGTEKNMGVGAPPSKEFAKSCRSGQRREVVTTATTGCRRSDSGEDSALGHVRG
jgi:hypothetical protein